MEPIIRVENLTKEHPDGFSLSIPSLEIREGAIYSLVGPNGAGKSTLLSLLGLLEEPGGGAIFFRGRSPGRSKGERLALRRRMFLVTENPVLFRTTVLKNITAGLRIRSMEKVRRHERAVEALRSVGLDGFERRQARKLSRGESQRVALARALALAPEVLFLDEPFTNIDKKHLATVEKLIKAVNRESNTTIIFTTHDLFQAYRLSDEIISLVRGRIVKGSPENIFSGEMEESEGRKAVRVSEKISISVNTGDSGTVHVSVPPGDIILSLEPFESSARNSFRGVVKRLDMEGSIVRATVRVDEGVELAAIISKASSEKMRLAVETPVFLTFKSSAVTLF